MGVSGIGNVDSKDLAREKPVIVRAAASASRDLDALLRAEIRGMHGGEVSFFNLLPVGDWWRPSVATVMLMGGGRWPEDFPVGDGSPAKLVRLAHDSLTLLMRLESVAIRFFSAKRTSAGCRGSGNTQMDPCPHNVLTVVIGG